MENASNALIMAAGILIGVIILTIAAYLFSSFGSTSAEIQAQIDARVVAEFNNNFTKYEGKDTCTIHDIISIANFAKKNNVDFPNPTDQYHVTVSIRQYRGGKDLSMLNDEELVSLLREWSNKQETGEIQLYTCTNIEYVGEPNNNKVKSITFKRND